MFFFFYPNWTTCKLCVLMYFPNLFRTWKLNFFHKPINPVHKNHPKKSPCVTLPLGVFLLVCSQFIVSCLVLSPPLLSIDPFLINCRQKTGLNFSHPGRETRKTLPRCAQCAGHTVQSNKWLLWLLRNSRGSTCHPGPLSDTRDCH